MSGPLTFGYVRVASARPAWVERWRQRILEHCQREGLTLDLVFADIAVPSTQRLRPAWTALLDVLTTHDASVVIVPHIDHLSRTAEIRFELQAQLAVLGTAAITLPRTRTRLDRGAS